MADNDEVTDDISEEDVMTMTLNSVNDVENFYKAYGKATGFGIRRGDNKKDDNGVIRYRTWKCAREGQRDDKWINR